MQLQGQAQPMTAQAVTAPPATRTAAEGGKIKAGIETGIEGEGTGIERGRGRGGVLGTGMPTEGAGEITIGTGG